MKYEDLHRTPEDHLLTDVFLVTLRLHGLVQAAGDRLGADAGMPSARFQVLDRISLAPSPLTVPQIARRMGLTRQTVHATIHHLMADGLVELIPNQDHRRSPLVWLTEGGRARAELVQQRHAAWVNRLAEGFDRADLQTAGRVLSDLCQRLEADAAPAQDAWREELEPWR